MPALTDPGWEAWADDVSRAVLQGRELYYCGMPKAADPPSDPAARHGYFLEWFDHDGDLVGERDLPGMTAERLQELLGDDDLDRVMCLTHAADGGLLRVLADEAGLFVDAERLEYFVSPWADPGYRTPGGYWPPPRVLPAFPGAEKIDPRSRRLSTDPGASDKTLA